MLSTSSEDNEDEPLYSTVEAAQCTGFSTRQLGYWAQQGLIVPVQPSYGRGSKRRYALNDLVQLHFVRRLKQKNWSTQRIREAMATLRGVMRDPNPLKNAIIVEEPGVFIALFKTQQGRQVLVEALNAGGQQVLEIVLETLTEETRLELAQLK